MNTTTPPTTGFRVGYIAGTVVRGLLKSLRGSVAQATPLPSEDCYSEIEHTPAMVRRQAVDLQAWYASNVRSNSTSAETIDQPSSRRLGSLDTLIAPVGTPVDWRLPADCNTPHWMDNLNTDGWTEADWDRLSR